MSKQTSNDRKWHFVDAYEYKRNGKTIKVPKHGKRMPKKKC